MPSLPSLSAFEDSGENLSESEAESDNRQLSTVYSEPEEEDILPVHSTPGPISSRTVKSTAHVPSSASSTARFASSIASRSANGRSGSHGSASLSRTSSASAVKGRRQESFDISVIPSLPDERDGSEEEAIEDGNESRGYSLRMSSDSVPDVYLPPQEDDVAEQDYSLTEALESVSRASSPFAQDLDEQRHAPENDATPKKKYDYSVSLRSEPAVRAYLAYYSTISNEIPIGITIRQIP